MYSQEKSKSQKSLPAYLWEKSTQKEYRLCNIDGNDDVIPKLTLHPAIIKQELCKYINT